MSLPDAPSASHPSLPGSRPHLRIGYAPLTDAAPLLVAEALGFFARQGLRVELSAAGAWAGLRDRLAFGALDAAHLLYPMPIAAALGLGQPARDWVAACGLGQNGNTVTLSNAVAAALGGLAAPLPGSAFASLARARAAAGQPLRLAVVHAYSTHNYLLREWLAAGGLDPDADLRLEVLPPPLVADALAAGQIDGFCAGEPWGSQAVLQGAGQVALGSGDIWPDHSEKLFVLDRALAEREPALATAATLAVLQACAWLDAPDNHAEAVAILRRQAFALLPEAALAPAFAGCHPLPGGGSTLLAHPLRFGPATRPDPVQAALWLARMRRWGHLPEGAPQAVALAPFANDIWARATAAWHRPQTADLPGGPTP